MLLRSIGPGQTIRIIHLELSQWFVRHEMGEKNMKKFLILVNSLLILALLAACSAPAANGGGAQQSLAQSDKPRDANPNVAPSALTQLAADNRAFAFNLYQQLRGASGNLFYSPHSISVALAMTYGGAAGSTAQQMAQALHFNLPATSLHPAFNALQLALASREKDPNDPKQTDFRLSVVNALWGQTGYNFLPAYLDLLATNYGAGMRMLDFKSDPEAGRKVINDWVASQTANKIQDLIPPSALDNATRLVLTNAIYFNAQWMTQFNAKNTQAGPFSLLDGSQVSVPMMNISHSYAYYQGNSVTAVELPYVGGQVSMVLLVPDAGKFSNFEQNLSAAQWDAIRAGLNYNQVNFSMPKFKFSADFMLNDPLVKLGMSDAFQAGKADFSGMDGSKDLYITKALHKAFINVDENGTEAAAATAIAIGLTAMPAQPVDLKVDRPFLFLIQDKPTGEILFLGRVTNPAK
jgi:serpin B